MNVVKYPTNEAQELIQDMQKILSSHTDIDKTCAFAIVILNRNGEAELFHEALETKYITTLIGGLEVLKVDMINNGVLTERHSLDE